MLNSLLDTIKEHRIYVSDSKLKTITLVCYFHEIQEAVQSFQEQFRDIQIERICVPEIYTPNFKETVFDNIPVEKLEKHLTGKNLAVFASFADSKNEGWKNIMDYLNSKKNDVFYYYSDKFYETGNALYFPPIKHFYQTHKKDIDKAFNLLCSTKSKQIFAERLKAILNGRSGYLQFTGAPEYFPEEPKNLVRKGNVIIDVGISSYHPELLQYSKLTQNTGKVIAFEASPIEYQKIINNFDKEQYQNVEIVNLGLWDKKATMNISDDIGGSSVVFNYLNRNIECNLIKLDDYLEENNIDRVDYIKMDIEGAEPYALKGAENTIKKHRPSLAICVYHEPCHLYSLINYVDSLNLGYKFYLEHHSAYMPETVMYAVPIPEYRNNLKNIYRRTKVTIQKTCYELQQKAIKTYNKIRISKLFTKRLIIYAAGSIYDELVKQNYFENCNVIAISDIRFTETNKQPNGYLSISPSEIDKYNPDCIYVAMKYPEIAHNYLSGILKNQGKNIKFINYND